MQGSQTPVLLGQISGLYGVRGWVKVFSYSQPREAILDYPVWQLRGPGETWEPTTLVEGRKQGKGIVARLEGVTDRDQAALYVGRDIAVAREALPALPADQFYWSDLEGLRVEHRDGTTLGKVRTLLETGANDVLVVEGDEERLIPFVMQQTILAVDLEEGVIRVDWEWE